MRLAELPLQRLESATPAYSTHRVPLAVAERLLTDVVPAAGDLVLAEVVQIGHHTRIERRDGRRATLFPGNEVVVCYGDRYAPAQFHAEVPEDLGPCQLAAAGGLAARVVSQHDRIHEPTQLRPVGMLAHADAQRVNLADWSLPEPKLAKRTPEIVAVVGTAMDCGKTTTAAHVVRGLRASGLRVGAAKVTGTGAGGDRWLLTDAGASPALDFTYVGLATTYRAGLPAVERAFAALCGHLAASEVDISVLEVSDGLAQPETDALVRSPVFKEVGTVIFAASDALGAAAGIEELSSLGLPVRAVSGRLTASRLATAEAATLIGLPVLGLDELGNPDLIRPLLAAGSGVQLHAA